MDFTATSIQFNGRGARIGTAYDITEHKRARAELVNRERTLRAIFDAKPECVKLLDAQGVLLNMNPAGL